jgi:hypothetical protein
MFIEVELFTIDHVIHGLVDAADDRLSDALNIKELTNIFVTEVQIARLLNVGKIPPVQLSDASVEKSAIVFAVPVEKDITHKSLFRRTSRQGYAVTLLLPNFELQGIVHLTEKLDVQRSLRVRTENFLAITDATATFVLNPQVTVKAGTIIFNRSMISAVAERLIMKKPPAA